MNDFEKKLKEDLERQNPDCLVLRNGWPDFAVVDKATGRMVKAVEGKAPGDWVHPHQADMHKALAAAGILVEAWYGIGGDYHIEEGV